MALLQNLLDRLFAPMMTGMLLLTGLLSGIQTRFLPYRRLGLALRLPFLARDKQEQTGISSFAAAMTALSGTIGTGNIIGVAVALQIGGAGSLFWMVIAAFVGMSVKYLEIALAVKTRVGGQGGPMMYIRKLLHAKWLSKLFCLLCILTGFGIGNLAQANAAGAILQRLPVAAQLKRWILLAAALLFAVSLYLGMRGGAAPKRIGKITSILTPVMASGYLIGCIWLLWIQRAKIPEAFSLVLSQAFGYRSAAGGFCGAGFLLAIKTGFTRGLFTNESGLGSAPIVHAAAEEQAETAGLWGVFEVFFDTVVMCSITGLTLLCSGVDFSDPYGMTAAAFCSVFSNFGFYFLAAALWLFGLAAAYGWGFYGSSSLRFLANGKETGQKLYAILFAGISFLGFFLSSSLVLQLSDLANCAMLLLNCGCLLLILCKNAQTNLKSEDRKRNQSKLKG